MGVINVATEGKSQDEGTVLDRGIVVYRSPQSPQEGFLEQGSET